MSTLSPIEFLNASLISNESGTSATGSVDVYYFGTSPVDNISLDFVESPPIRAIDVVQPSTYFWTYLAAANPTSGIVGIVGSKSFVSGDKIGTVIFTLDPNVKTYQFALQAGSNTTVGGVQLADLPAPISAVGITSVTGTASNDRLIGADGPDLIYGLAGSDTLDGGLGADTLIGGDGDDQISDGGGNDTIDGGSGSDTFVLSGPRSDYTVLWNSALSVFTINSKADGVDSVTAVESFKFSDVTLSSTTLANTTPPTISITSSKTNLAAGQAATLTFAISESVSDFVVGDITVSGGTLSNFSGSGTSYTAIFTPFGNSTINGVVSVASNKFSDAAGNFNVDGSDANNTVSITINTVPADTTPPTIAVSTNKTSLSAGQTATVNFVISEAVSDFAVSDVAVSGGTLSNFSGSGTSYMATFTPTANSKVKGVVIVASNKFSDAAGNFNVDGSNPNNTVTMAVNTVIGPNAKPTAASSTLNTFEDTALVLTLANFAFKDANSYDSLQSISLITLPAKGSLKLGDTPVAAGQSISVADLSAGKLAFTPAPDAYGSSYAKVGFKVSDGKDLSTSAYYLTVNVTAVNDAPTVAKPITTPLSLIEGKAFSFSLPSGTFKDVDDTVLTYSATGLLAGMAIDPKTGKISGTPGYSAADLESNTVTIKATDKGGLSASTPLTVKVTNTPTIAGSTKDDNIVAGAGPDSISGGNGNDTLVGGAGNDVLTGGDGVDRFVFDTSLGSSNVDTIKDFVTGTDKIVLSAKVFPKFTGSSAGTPIAAGNLVIGAGSTAKAADSNDYLIYDTESDLLYYDADGSGPGTPVAFAKVELTGTAAPAFGDFLVVS